MAQRQVLRYNAARDASIVSGEIPALGPEDVLAASLCCSVSAGTELPFYRGNALLMNARIEDGLYVDAPGAITYPMQSDMPGYWYMGYANVATVKAVGAGVTGLKPGDVVFHQTPHMSHHVQSPDLCLKLPSDVDPHHAALLILVDIAFNAILDAKVKLMDNVVVIGLGTIGQLIAQVAKLAGATVWVSDLLDDRLALAERLGADRTVNPSRDGDLGQVVRDAMPGGADVVFEVSGNPAALTDAARAVRREGIVSIVSYYQQPPATVQMGREFHTNRIRFQSSSKGGILPELTHQYDRRRRLATSLELILSRLQIEPLISHRVPFAEYPDTLKMIDVNPSACQAVVITY